MDRNRLIGVALVVVSAFGFGSGALFAKPVYAAGADWHVLSAWRFGLGAVLAWAWLALVPGRWAGLRRTSRRVVLASLALGVLYTGNSATYFAGLETVPASLAALIVYIYPVLVAVLALRFGRRLEGRRAWGALGIAVGFFLAVLTTQALSDEGIVFAVPWLTIVFFVIATIIAGILAAVLPARRASRLNVLEALQYE